MNCRKCREQIIASLAAGQSWLSTEADDHLQSCVRCTEYFQSQRELFGSIDAGLHLLVNPPIPTSFLPGVRMRLAEQPSFVPNARLRWELVSSCAAILLALAVSHLVRKPVLHGSSSITPVVSQRPVNDSSTQPITSGLLAPTPSHIESAKHNNSSRPTHTEPEVIVSTEERQAFARFVADIPKPPEMAVVLASPGDEAVPDPAEIALLQIQSLEVTPLDDSASE